MNCVHYFCRCDGLHVVQDLGPADPLADLPQQTIHLEFRDHADDGCGALRLDHMRFLPDESRLFFFVASIVRI